MHRFFFCHVVHYTLSTNSASKTIAPNYTVTPTTCFSIKILHVSCTACTLPTQNRQAFIHGIDQNPVSTLAMELGLTLVPMDHCKISANDGSPVEQGVDERIQSLWNSVLDECAAKQQQQLAPPEENTNSSSWEASPVDQRQHGSVAAADSRGETSEESNGEVSSNAGSDAAEVVFENEPQGHVSAPVNGTSTEGEAPGRMGLAAGLSLMGKEGKRSSRGAARSAGRGAKSEGRVPRAKVEPTTPMSLGQVLEETAQPHLANFSEAEHELWGWHRGNLEISCGAVSSGIDDDV